MRKQEKLFIDRGRLTGSLFFLRWMENPFHANLYFVHPIDKLRLVLFLIFTSTLNISYVFVAMFLRNPSSQRGSDRLIDLHGLHVNEAIHILKVELGTLKSTARATGERMQVMICVGTGHHTKGSRTARLPIAVEQFLLEEGLHYTQAQPGLLRVVVF
jgi:hypothetical protein